MRLAPDAKVNDSQKLRSFFSSRPGRLRIRGRRQVDTPAGVEGSGLNLFDNPPLRLGQHHERVLYAGPHLAHRGPVFLPLGLQHRVVSSLYELDFLGKPT
jgi:hypothetical protein